MQTLIEKMDGETRKLYERGELTMADLKEKGLLPAYDEEEGEFDQEESEFDYRIICKPRELFIIHF